MPAMMPLQHAIRHAQSKGTTVPTCSLTSCGCQVVQMRRQRVFELGHGLVCVELDLWVEHAHLGIPEVRSHLVDQLGDLKRLDTSDRPCVQPT